MKKILDWLVLLCVALHCGSTPPTNEVLMKADALVFRDEDDALVYRPSDVTGNRLEPRLRGIPVRKGDVLPLLDVLPEKDGVVLEVRLPSGERAYLGDGQFDVRPIEK